MNSSLPWFASREAADAYTEGNGALNFAAGFLRDFGQVCSALSQLLTCKMDGEQDCCF